MGTSMDDPAMASRPMGTSMDDSSYYVHPVAPTNTITPERERVALDLSAVGRGISL